MGLAQYQQQHYTGHCPHLFTDDSIFVDCEFDHVIAEGAQISDCLFSNCALKNVDWYWCQAFRVTFVNCKFSDCDLRGNFDEARFVSCLFIQCRYDRDNLGGETEWAEATAISCEVIGAPLPIVKSHSY